ncbi:MAG: peptide deformylase [Deltaproteobacteria bacterium]|nr:peptide deformylase [Deltaproteobacteria bacterium]MBI3078662.1 peptide deformylase [Deltaproteobacteria bacterium]
MAILEILKYPDPRLRMKAEPVKEITPEIRQFLDDLAETMYAAPGVGLGATQVGRLVRALVIDTSRDGSSPLKLVNPEITAWEGEVTWEEGCLSIPDFTEEVRRWAKVVVQGLDPNGERVEIKAEELQAVALQHEIDHLDGILFIDRLSSLKKDIFRRKWKKYVEQGRKPSSSDRSSRASGTRPVL